jgi:hypothetical protein
MLSLKPGAVQLDHLNDAVGSGVMPGLSGSRPVNVFLRPDALKRSSHPGFPVRGWDVAMTLLAHLGTGVARVDSARALGLAHTPTHTGSGQCADQGDLDKSRS